MADASVRPAVPADANDVARLLLAHWIMSPSAAVTERIAALDPAEVTASWHEAITAPPSTRHLALTALAGDRIIGFLASSPAADFGGDRDIELLELVVDPAYRRQGHGSRLMAAWADLSRESGATGGVMWITGSDDNARAFLVGAGWGPDGASRSLDITGDGHEVLRQVRLVTALSDVSPPGSLGV